MRLLSSVAEFLSDENPPKDSLFTLFYALNEFYPLDYHLKLLETEKEQSLPILRSLEDLVGIRKEILRLIEVFVSSPGNHSLIPEFLDCIFQNLFMNPKNGLNPNAFDLLKLAKKLWHYCGDKPNSQVFNMHLADSPLEKHHPKSEFFQGNSSTSLNDTGPTAKLSGFTLKMGGSNTKNSGSNIKSNGFPLQSSAASKPMSNSSKLKSQGSNNSDGFIKDASEVKFDSVKLISTLPITVSESSSRIMKKPPPTQSSRHTSKSPIPIFKTRKSQSQMFSPEGDQHRKTVIKPQNYLLYSEILLQVMSFLLDPEKQQAYFTSRKAITERFKPFEELDENLTLVIHLWINCLIHMEQQTNNNDKTMPFAAPPKLSPPKLAISIQSNQSVSALSLSVEKSSEEKTRKRSRPIVTADRLLESLDSILPETLLPKTYKKLLNILTFSFEQKLNIERFLIPMLWKRSETSGFGKFLHRLIGLQKINEERFYRIIINIPNFFVFLGAFQAKMNEVKGEHPLKFEIFLNHVLEFMLLQGDVMKHLKVFSFY